MKSVPREAFTAHTQGTVLANTFTREHLDSVLPYQARPRHVRGHQGALRRSVTWHGRLPHQACQKWLPLDSIPIPRPECAWRVRASSIAPERDDDRQKFGVKRKHARGIFQITSPRGYFCRNQFLRVPARVVHRRGSPGSGTASVSRYVGARVDGKLDHPHCPRTWLL